MHRLYIRSIVLEIVPSKQSRMRGCAIFLVFLLHLILITSSLRADHIIKMTLNSGEVINNFKLERLLDNTLYLRLLNDEGREVRTPMGEIQSIISSRDSFISKHDFTKLSTPDKLTILEAMVLKDFSSPPVSESAETPVYVEKQLELTFLLSLLLILIIAIILLLRHKPKRDDQGSIPGVKEMASTAFFWADYHRGRIGSDDSGEGE